MINKSPPREFTNTRIVYDKMLFSYENGGVEFDITELENHFGEQIPKSTIAQSISRITADYFNGVRFYTRTSNGRIYLGCHNPRPKIMNDRECQSSESILDILK